MDILGVYLESAHANRTLNIYSQICVSMRNLNFDEYSHIRDYLIFCLHHGNHLRFNVISKLTVAQVHSSRCEGGVHTISINNLKDGHQDVMLSEDEFQLLLTYIEVRKQRNSSSESVFLSWSGNKMSASTMSAKIDEIFNQL